MLGNNYGNSCNQEAFCLTAFFASYFAISMVNACMFTVSTNFI